MKKPLTVFVASMLATLGSQSAAAASFMPFGPQNDVALSTVTETWGWEIIYRGDYRASLTISEMFQGAKTYVMLAGIRDGSLTIDVLAATTLADLQTYTAEDQSHLSNGAQWYYNGGSLGFAGADDTINQNSADINGLAERDRLSWHTSGAASYRGLPTYVNGGWRSGFNTGLNGSTGWDRIVFTTDTIPGMSGAVPEPSTWAMLIVGFGAVGAGMRTSRRKRANPAAA